MSSADKNAAMAIFDGSDIDPLFRQVLIAAGENGVLVAETRGPEGWPTEPAQVREELGAAGFIVTEEKTDELEAAWQQIREYLSGTRDRFDLEIDFSLVGGEFQQLVLEACARVYHGETASYAQLATRIGHPGAARAVGSALKNNPVALIIPCHRIVRENGSSGEYASGPDVKEYLLGLEKPVPVAG